MPCSPQSEPSFIQKMTFVKNFLVQACDAPLQVIATTGGRALGDAAIHLVTFGTDDLVRSLFRPKGARTMRHGRGRIPRNRARWQTNLFPEPADIIGDTVRSTTDLKRPTYSQGANFLWEIDAFTQKAFYYFDIVNLAADTTFDWTSGIIASPAANCEQDRFMMEDGSRTVGTGAWRAMVFPSIRYQQGPARASGSGFRIEKGTWFIVFVCRVKKSSSGQTVGTAYIRLAQDIVDPKPCQVSKPVSVGPGDSRELFVSAVITGGMTMQAMVLALDAGMIFNQGQLICLRLDKDEE